MILLTGSAGKTGRTVLAALRDRGAAVRALVRSSFQSAEVEKLGATETVQGDLQDPKAVERAAEGVRAIYHICPNVSPHEIPIGSHVLAAAQRAGAEYLVYHSVIHPQTESMPHHWRKLRVEELILASGLPFTILQPTAYFQNLLASWTSITQEGVLPLPYPPHTRLSLVDVGDVAAVAAKVLTEPGHQGATYELCGTEPLAQTEVAAALARGLGRPVACREISHEEWEAEARKGGLGDEAIDALLAMFRYYGRHGLAGNPKVLQHLLGRAPTSLEEFVERATSESARV